MRTRIRRIAGLLLAAALAAAAGGATGCSPEQQVPPTRAPVEPDRTPEDPRLPLSGEINQMGDRVAVGDWEFVVLSADGGESSEGAGDEAPQDGARLEIVVELTNRGTDGAQVGADEFVLLDGVGGAYVPVSENRVIGPETWDAGQTDEISLPFDVPVGAADLTLEFRPRSGGLAAVFIR